MYNIKINYGWAEPTITNSELSAFHDTKAKVRNNKDFLGKSIPEVQSALNANKRKIVDKPLQNIAAKHNVEAKFLESELIKLCTGNFTLDELKNGLAKKGIHLSCSAIANFLKKRKASFDNQISLKATLGDTIEQLRSYFFTYPEICEKLNGMGIRTLKFTPISVNLICKYFRINDDGSNFKDDFIFKCTLWQLQIK